MAIPNGWSAKRGPTGETYYWPMDLSSGTTWVYPIVEDPVELQNTWAKLTYITLRRNGLSAEEEGAIIRDSDVFSPVTNSLGNMAPSSKKLPI